MGIERSLGDERLGDDTIMDFVYIYILIVIFNFLIMQFDRVFEFDPNPIPNQVAHNNDVLYFFSKMIILSL